VGTVGNTISIGPLWAARRSIAAPNTPDSRLTSPERLPGKTNMIGGSARRRSASSALGRKSAMRSASGWPTKVQGGPPSRRCACGSNGKIAST
jgi:hypothetical protein